MSIIPEKIAQPDQFLFDSNTNALVGLRSGRGGSDMLPPRILYTGGLPSGLIDALGNTISIGGVPIIVTANASPAVVGTTLTAVVQTGYTVTNPQWVRDTGSGPVAISGATNLTYQLQPADFAPAGSVIQYRVYLTGVLTNVTSAAFTVPNAAATGTTFGPYTKGQTVILADGTSFITANGDNFDSPLDIIGPAAPLGRYTTTDVYAGGGGIGRGPRGYGPNATTQPPSIGGYEADPLHTGYNDANRGVAIASYNDVMVQSAGKLALKSRYSPTAENAKAVNPANVTCVSAMITSMHSLVFTAPFYIEMKSGISMPTVLGGDHDTFWLQQVDYTAAHSITILEIDIESTAVNTASNSYNFNNGVSTPFLDGAPPAIDSSGTMYVRGMSIWFDGTNWNLTHWRNGVAIKTRVLSGYDNTKPHYFLASQHITTGGTGGDTYSGAAWQAAGATGAVTTYDYVVVNTATGTTLAPSNTNAATAPAITINVNFADSASVTTLTDTTSLWGSAVPENIVCVALESNEPTNAGGTSYGGGYRGFPAGIAYNSSTLALTITPTSMTQPGRVEILRMAQQTGGVSCVPQRIIVNVGPNVSVATLPIATKNVAYSFDLYAVCDCGVLVSDANGNRAKTIVVSGLPTGLTYNDTTGLITGTTTVDFNKSVSVTVTNNNAQSVTKLVGFSTTVAATANETAVLPVIQGSPTFRNAYVPNDSSTVTPGAATPPQINALAPLSGGTVTLANASTTTSPTRELLTMPNGNQVYAAHFTGASSQFLSANGLTLTPGGSLVMVYAATVAGVNNTIFERTLNASNTTTNREQIMTLAAGVTARRCDSTGSGFIDAETVSQRNTTGVHVALGVFPTGDVTGGGKVVSMNFDGVATAVTAAVAGNITSLDTINMGARIGAGTTNLPFNGYLIAAYDLSAEFTAAQREEFMVYLNAKYGIVNLA